MGARHPSAPRRHGNPGGPYARRVTASRSQTLRWVGLALLAAAVAVVGAALGLRLAGPVASETEIGRVSLDVEPALHGGATAFVPLADWGFSADAFDAPFEIRAELRSLERPAVLRAAEGDFSVLDASERELEHAARSAVARGLAWGLGGALVLLGVATLVWRRLRPRWALLALGGAIALVGAVASALAAHASFDARAFESPTYFARGAELQRILEVAENERVESAYGSTFASILRSVSAVLAETPVGEPATRDLVLASDLHGNPLVIGPLSRAVGDVPVLGVGDFGQRGGEAEAAALAPRVAALGERVIAVSGNHDSSELMRRLAEEGVTVLGSDAAGIGAPSGSSIVEVDGITIAGFPDPLEWRGRGDPPDRPVTFDDLPDPEAAYDQAVTDVIEWFDTLPQRPDVAMVHQNGLALALAASLDERGERRPLTIVSGHDHRQHVDRFGEVVVVDGGSVGAGGVFDAGRQPIGLARLHFDSSSPVLGGVDLIAIEPFSGQAQATRVVIDAMCPGEETCRVEPPAPGSGPVGVMRPVA
jgi:hypothetical protein